MLILYVVRTVRLQTYIGLKIATFTGHFTWRGVKIANFKGAYSKCHLFHFFTRLMQMLYFFYTELPRVLLVILFSWNFVGDLAQKLIMIQTIRILAKNALNVHFRTFLIMSWSVAKWNRDCTFENNKPGNTTYFSCLYYFFPIKIYI